MNHFTLLLVLLIIVFFLYKRKTLFEVRSVDHNILPHLRFDKWINYDPNKKYKKAKYCVLLTTAVFGIPNENPRSRVSQYEQAIDAWLDGSNLELFIVESTGYPFNQYRGNSRIHIHTFTPKIIPNRSNYSTSQREAEAILEAIDHFKSLMKKYDVVFKITGKYYIPHFQEQMKNLPLVDLYIQTRDTWSKFIATEIFGFRKQLAYTIYEDPAHNIESSIGAPGGLRNIEIYINEFIKSNPQYVVFKLPVLKLGWVVYRSGAKDYVDEL